MSRGLKRCRRQVYHAHSMSRHSVLQRGMGREVESQRQGDLAFVPGTSSPVGLFTWAVHTISHSGLDAVLCSLSTRPTTCASLDQAT
jgi:hypothetical protein